PRNEVGGGSRNRFGFAWPGGRTDRKGDTGDRRTPTLLSQGGNESQKGAGAFVKPHPQAVGDRCAADGGADSGMDGSRCRPATGRGESGGRCAGRTAVRHTSAGHTSAGHTSDRSRASCICRLDTAFG